MTALSDERMPWFPCYPEKLLGALSGMQTDCWCIYVILLLRIYEVGGPVPETVETLALRSHMPSLRVKNALEKLLASGKIITAEGMFSNPMAEAELSARNSIAAAKKARGKTAADARWKKTEAKQQNGHANGIANAVLGDTHLHLHKQSSIERAEDQRAPKPKAPSKGTRIPKDWQPDIVYAKGKGLSEREALREAEKFKNYWTAKSGANATKSDWPKTWFNWCIEAAQRLGREPPAPDRQVTAETASREQWIKVIFLWRNSNNWRLSWGPEPGKPGCIAPTDLLDLSIEDLEKLMQPPK